MRFPARTKLASVSVRAGTATVELRHARTASTAFDISLRPARAAQVVYTLTALPGVKQVLIKVNGIDRAMVIGSKLLPRLLDGGFVQAFLAKGRLESFVRRIPVRVVLNADAALVGAALYALDAAGSELLAA